MEVSVARYVAHSSDHRAHIPLPIYPSPYNIYYRHTHALLHSRLPEIRQKLHQYNTGVLHVLATEVGRHRAIDAIESDLAEPQYWKGEPAPRLVYT